MMMANNEREHDVSLGSNGLSYFQMRTKDTSAGSNSSKSNGPLRGIIMVGNEQERSTMGKRYWPACCGAVAVDISWSSRIRGHVAARYAMPASEERWTMGNRAASGLVERQSTQ